MARNQQIRVACLVFCTAMATGLASACGGSGPNQKPATTEPVTEPGITNACSLLSEKEISDTVGNSVDKGRAEAGTEVCKWRTETPSDVDALLMVREKGSIRAQVLCGDLRKEAANRQTIAGLGEVAVWKFSSEGPLFNSGELEVCAAKGYVSLTLQGKRDETVLRTAATTLVQKVLDRL